MKIIKIEEVVSKKLVGGSLPDIDTDFAGRDRANVKAYMELRFGRSQVCSVGTFSTMKPKGLVKDLARTTSIDFMEVNLITSIIDGDDTSMLDIIRRAASEPRLKQFIKQNSDLFYMIPSLLLQPKAHSIHACALIIFPSVMSASEWAPMRLQNGLIVSEWSGKEMDEAGFLKEDILGIRQLDKFTDIIAMIKEGGKQAPDIYNLPLDDKEVYRYFSNGWNGDVFQMGSAGLTSYTQSMKPRQIEDLIAANALYRPGPMENHYHEIYAKCKNEGRAPEYLWGTEEITKDTYGLLIYQEQIMQIFQEIGGLNMREADDVRRAVGKGKVDEMLSWKETLLKGFLDKGANEEEFQEVWDAMIEFTKYSFNKSHSAAYALTGYACQYLKVHFPIEYWTVSLRFANEKDSLTYLSEILSTGKIAIKAPDINNSQMSMHSNQESSTIFWGIESIKGIGEATAEQIIAERKKNGRYRNFADFYFRNTFKGSKVKKGAIEALIACGAFDDLYNFEGAEERRHLLIKRYRKFGRKKVSNPLRDAYTIGKLDKRWWWISKQKSLTGLAFIDYESIAEELDAGGTFCTAREFSQRQDRGISRTFGGYIVDCRIGKSKNGPYVKLLVEHNYKMFKLMIWADEYKIYKEQLQKCEKSLIIFNGVLKYDKKYSKANQFTVNKETKLYVLS